MRRVVLLVGSLLLASCHAVFGVELEIDAQATSTMPACWSDPEFFGLGKLPAAKYWDSALDEPWPSAKASCEAKGDAHLVVTSRVDGEWDALLTAGLATDYWIGISDEAAEGDYVAVTGESVGLAHPPWGATEPSGGRSENCVAFGAGTLNDLPCGAAKRTLCECELPVTCMPSTGDPAYELVTGPFDFAGAVAACIALGKQLVQTDSVAEQLALEAQFANRRFWIDATDANSEGEWRTSTGCTPALRWKHQAVISEPDGGTSENCAAFLVDGLVDAACAGLLLDALCEAP